MPDPISVMSGISQLFDYAQIMTVVQLALSVIVSIVFLSIVFIAELGDYEMPREVSNGLEIAAFSVLTCSVLLGALILGIDFLFFPYLMESLWIS